MKETVKVDADLLGKVRRHTKKTKQTIGGFFEFTAAKEMDGPKFETHDNSDKFLEFLSSREIRHKCLGHTTVVMSVLDPIQLGVSFGIYKAQNDPAYKNF